MAEAQEKSKEPEAVTAPAPAAEAAEVVALKVIPVLSRDFSLAIHSFQTHNAVVPAGTTKEQLLDPQLWNHVSTKIKLHDEIRVIEENGAFMARLFVNFRHNLDVRVKILEFYELEAVDYTKMANTDNYDVKNRGAAGGWCVIDKKSGKAMFTNLLSQSAAFARKEQYIATLSR
jgi:hypothetical protein